MTAAITAPVVEATIANSAIQNVAHAARDVARAATVAPRASSAA